MFSFAFEIRLNQTIRFLFLRFSIFSISFIVDLIHQNISFEGGTNSSGGASLSQNFKVNLQFFRLFPFSFIFQGFWDLLHVATAADAEWINLHQLSFIAFLF